MHSNTIYQDTTNGVEDQYLVYVLYREDHIPHYVGATLKPSRPYSNQHHARIDYNVTSVEIVQECLSLEDASILEDQLINQYGRQTDGGTLVNIQGGGHGLITHTDETKDKISLAKKGKPKSEEAKLKMSLAKKGKPLSDEHKAIISASQKGRVFSNEHKAKLKAAWARRKAAALK